MAQTSTVSFGNPLTAPFQIQAQNLQQQQALAQAMMQQGMQPIDPSRTASGGLVVPISPLEGLAHAGQMLAGAMMNRNVDNKMMDLSNKQSAFMMNMLAPKPIYADNTQAPTPAPAATAAAPVANAPAVDPSGDLAKLINDPSIYQGAGAPTPNVPMSRGNAGAAVSEPPAVAPEAGQKLASAIMGGMNFAPSSGADTVANPVANDSAAASPSPQAVGRQIIGYQPSPLNPTGMPAGFAAYMLGADPGKYFETQAKMYEPTDLIKTLTAAGIDPHSTLGQQILQQNIAKTNYIAPTPLRDGAGYLTPDGQFHTTPNSKEGTMLVPDSTSPTGYKVVQIPGAMAARQAGSKADAAGRNSVEPITGYDKDGNPVFGNKLQAATGGNGGGGGVQTGSRFSGYQPPGGNGFRPGLRPGEGEAQMGLANFGVDQFKQVRAAAAESKDRASMIDHQIDLAKQTDFGPGANYKASVSAVLHGLGLNEHPTFAENYQEMKKYWVNLGAAQSKALGGTGTDKQLDTMLEGVTGPQMLSSVIPKVGAYLKSREYAIQAHDSFLGNFVGQDTNNAAKINQAETAWRKSYNPQAFQQLVQLQQMPQAKQQTYVGNLRKNNPRLYQQLNTAAQLLQ